MTAEDLIAELRLEPLPDEGGYFRETYRSATSIPGATKAHGTAIYFLITPDQFSALHRLPTDEVWHFYLGDPVEQIRLTDSGHLERVLLGQDIFANPKQEMQSVVPAGVWQGTRLAPGGTFALLGTTMAPGFDFDDLEMADGATLARQFPKLKNAISPYTLSS